MEVVMQEQDKRAVESMCRCGLDLEGVQNVFPSLPREEIDAIYKSVNTQVHSGEKIGRLYSEML